MDKKEKEHCSKCNGKIKGEGYKHPKGKICDKCHTDEGVREIMEIIGE